MTIYVCVTVLRYCCGYHTKTWSGGTLCIALRRMYVRLSQFLDDPGIYVDTKKESMGTAIFHS